MNNQTHCFAWTGINTLGQKITGEIHADNKNNGIQKLIHDGITILTIQKNKSFTFQKQKWNQETLLDFTQQLLLLLQASIPLTDALSLMASSEKNKTAQTLLISLKNKMIAGERFSAALNCFPQHFNAHFCHLICAGEHSGNLENVLTRIIENQEQLNEINRKIKKALFYPISILIISILISIGLLIFVIPQFSAIYSNFGSQLPYMTRLVITISHAITQHSLLYAVFLSAFLCTLKKYCRLSQIFIQMAFHMPFFKNIIVIQQITQWSQSLSLAFSSHIPLIDALQLANLTVTQAQMQKQLQETREAVIAGKKLHMALNTCHDFPERARYLIAVGENADALDIMTQKVALLYHRQFSDKLDHLSKLVEPVIMIIVAGLISGLILAMYMPIFQMGSIV